MPIRLEEREWWVVWGQIEGIGPILLQRVQRQFGSLAAAWAAPASDLLAVEGIGLQLANMIATQRQELDAVAFLEQHDRLNPHYWTPADVAYPRLLLELPDPPPVLYYDGAAEGADLAGLLPTVAMVGTRQPTDYGKRWTRRLSQALAQHGVTIISGLATGIDTEAHRSCLQGAGRTIAVVGTGLDRVYPWSNRGLQQQILAHGGLILSEHPAGTGPDRTHFPRRNRIIAGLSRLILVMEAGVKSGALITAKFANDYGRDVAVLAGSLDNPQALGCLQLINRGAAVIEGEAELLATLGTLPQLPPVAESVAEPADLPIELTALLATLTRLIQTNAGQAVPFDVLVQQTQQPTASVASALLQLELMGLVSQQPGMRYQRL